MHVVRAIGLIVFIGMFGPSLIPAQPPAPPTYPAINPANARLEQTLGGLKAAGVDIAASDAIEGLFAACEDRGLHYWTADLMLGVRASRAGNFALRGHEGPVLSVVAGGPVVASAGVDGKILLWAPPGDKARLVLDAKGPVRALALSVDGKTLASSGEDGSIQLWDTEKGQPGAKIAASKDWELALAFSADGKFLAAGGYDGKWRLFAVPGGQPVREADANAPPAKKEDPREVNVVTALAFAPDGKTLAVAGSDGKIYQFQTDGKLIRTLTGHTAGISDLVFHPTGSLLVSAGKDRTIRLWNPTNGQAIKTLEGHESWVQGATFYHHGTHLASVSADRTVKLWDLSDPTKK